jgi:endo-1,4-beta-xylanase
MQINAKSVSLAIAVLFCALWPASWLANAQPALRERAAAPDAQSVADVATGFESGTTEGWVPNVGTENLTVVSSDAHTGSRSLLTSNRLQPFHGCRINVLSQVATGSRYQITVWAKMAPGVPASNLMVTLRRTLSGVTTFHSVVPAAAVTSNQWVKLTAAYDYNLSHDAISLYVESSSGTASFLIDDFELAQIQPLQIQNDIPSVKDVLAPHFKIGAAIVPSKTTGVHSQLLSKHFNSITAENDMKWGPIHPTESTYNFGPADTMVNYAVANGMQVRGHAIVWHQQNPSWLFLDASGNAMTPTPANKALLLERLEAHIRAVIGRYGTDVYAWDVVNEVIDPGQADGFRRSPWFQICGTDYIDRAFQIAREVAPTAKLYINDYDTTNPTKRVFLLNLIQNLKARGIPVDGIGHQMHNNIDYPSISSIVETINMFSSIPGVDNQITEMDISVYNNGTQMYTAVPSGVLRKQGYRYRDHFDAFRSLQGKISSVTLWGLADDATWLSTFPIARLEAPLLFDDALQAKLAYWGIVDPARLRVTLSGRVTTPSGAALRNAVVTIFDAQGTGRSVTTSSFGVYSISGVEANADSYIVRVTSKRYRFNPRTVVVEDAMSNLDFPGLE